MIGVVVVVVVAVDAGDSEVARSSTPMSRSSRTKWWTWLGKWTRRA
jgi:hypothetical protein